MQRHPGNFVVVILAAGLIAGAAGAKPEKLVFGTAGGDVSQACNSADVDINGASGTYVLTGDCGTVAINGASNVVYVEAAARIRITGAGNKVTWVRGAGKAKKPSVKNTGLANQVAKGALPDASGGGSGVRVATGSGGTALQVGGVALNVPALGTATGAGGPAVAANGNAAAEAMGPIAVGDSNKEIKRACNGEDVSVTGNENHLVLSGDCGIVSVTGNENQIELEAATEISTLGNDNTINYRRGVKTKKPRLSNLGNDNSLRQIE